MRPERVRIFRHHDVGVVERQPGGVVSTRPRVVQGRLVRPHVHQDVLFVELLPHVDHVAEVSERLGALRLAGLADLGGQFVQVGDDVVHPALLVTFVRRGRVDLCGHRHATGDVRGLGLGAAHATQTRRDKQLAGQAVRGPRHAALLVDHPARVQHGDGGAVHNALGADVHVGPGGHLAILADAQGVHALPVVGLAVIGDDHAVGHHHAGGLLVGREQPERMAGVHDQGLVFFHLAQILHGQTVLRPVLEHRPVAAVGDELLGVLRHGRVEVVLDHQHDRGGLAALGRVPIDGVRLHVVRRAQAVHVNASVVLELQGKFRGELRMLMRREITKRVAQRKFFFLGRQDVLAHWGVAPFGVALDGRRQRLRKALLNNGSEFSLRHGHGFLVKRPVFLSNPYGQCLQPL